VAEEEDDTTEFKEVNSQNPVRTITDTAEGYAVAFLNGNGGRILWGIRDADRCVAGVSLDSQARDKIRKEIAGRLLHIQPSLDPTQYRLDFHPVADGPQPGELFVVELSLERRKDNQPYYCHNGDLFVRMNGVKQKLTGPRLTAWIQQRLHSPSLVADVVDDPIRERISAFRSDRVGKILAGKTPVPLELGPKLVLHLFPVRAFSKQVALDLKSAQKDGNSLEPMGRPRTYGPLCFNFDGLFSTGGLESQKPYSYIQLFRNGVMEAVYARISRDKLVFGLDCERQVVKAPGTSYMQFQKHLGLGPPLFITITMLSIRGFIIMPCGPNDPIEFHNWLGMPIAPVDQDALLAPEVLVEHEDADIGRLVRPAFDSIWQASGWPGSQGYDEAGNWVGLRIR
jgi:hypothetical protein